MILVHYGMLKIVVIIIIITIMSINLFASNHSDPQQ